MSAQGPSTAPSIPAGPIGRAAAWVGPELARRDDRIVRHDAADITEINAAVRHFEAGGEPLQSISRTSFPFSGLGRKLDALPGELLEGRGFVMLRNLPEQRYVLESAAIAYLGMGRHPGSLRSSNGRGRWSVSLTAG